MNRAAIVDQLAEVERHVKLGQQYIARQRAVIAELERDGHSTTEARAILKTFLETQQLHEWHLNHLREELRALAGRKSEPMTSGLSHETPATCSRCGGKALLRGRGPDAFNRDGKTKVWLFRCEECGKEFVQKVEA